MALTFLYVPQSLDSVSQSAVTLQLGLLVAPIKARPHPSISSASLGLPDFSQVDILGVRYTSVLSRVQASRLIVTRGLSSRIERALRLSLENSPEESLTSPGRWPLCVINQKTRERERARFRQIGEPE